MSSGLGLDNAVVLYWQLTDITWTSDELEHIMA